MDVFSATQLVCHLRPCIKSADLGVSARLALTFGDLQEDLNQERDNFDTVRLPVPGMIEWYIE